MMKIFDLRMHDGSRHFADLPERYDPNEPEWHRLRAHVVAMPGAVLLSFVTDDITEAWLDWSYRGHHFSANNQHGNWWLFVHDPACADEIMSEVVTWLAELLR